VLAAGACEPHRGDKVTRPIVVSDGSERSADADAPPTPIRDAPAAPGPRAAVTGARDYLQRFADPARDSRLGVALAAGPYRLRWQAALQEAPALAVLTGGDRVVVESRDGFELFTLDGKPAGRGAHGNDAVLLDPGNAVLYAAHPSGMFAGWSLADGAFAFAFPTRQSAGFQRDPIARRGSQLLLASTEQPIMSTSGRVPELGLLEWQDLGAPMQLDSNGAVMTAREAAVLMVHAVPIRTALAGASLVVAAPGRVIFADAASLKVTRQLAADQTPVALSVDEAGDAHLVVRTAAGAALWIVTPAGDRRATVPLFDLGVTTPPVLGLDHAIHLIGERRIATLHPDGTPAWTAALDAPIAGAVAVPGALVVAAGAEVVAFDAAGARRVVHHFDGIRLATAPVVTARGVLVASDRVLYGLAP
jgi:hypothetical protein